MHPWPEVVLGLKFGQEHMRFVASDFVCFSGILKYILKYFLCFLRFGYEEYLDKAYASGGLHL